MQNTQTMGKEINGFYDDNGNKVNPDLLPKPQLCLSCKSNVAEDWEENLLCQMNRYDQRNDKEFKCFAYKAI
jgi:hypothetical protein